MSSPDKNFQEPNIFSSSIQKKKLDKKILKNTLEKYNKKDNNFQNNKQLRLLIQDFYLKCNNENESFFDSNEGKNLIENSMKELLRIKESNVDGKIEWKDLSKELDILQTKLSGKYWKLAPLIDFKLKLTPQQKNDNFYQFKVFIAGGIAGVCSKTVGAPLSRITTLQQTHEFRSVASSIPLSNIGWAKKILKEEGISGFFRGNLADVIRSIPYSGICYLVYEKLKSIFLPYDKSTNGRNARLMAGGLSGPLSLILVYPIDVIRTRLAAQTSSDIKYKGILHTFNRIRKEEGMKAFYRGSSVSLFQSFPNLAINFTIFEECVDILHEKGKTGVFYSIASGIISGTCAQTVTYPLDVVVRNMQLDGKSEKFKTPLDLVKIVFKNQGISGFYRGYTAMLCKSIPVCATSFGIYDQMRRFFNLKPKI